MYFIKKKMLQNIINFTKKNTFIICTIFILISFCSYFLEYKIYTKLHKNNVFNSYNIDIKKPIKKILNKINTKQKKIFIMMFFLKKCIYFIGNTLLLGSIIILIRYFNEKKKKVFCFI